MRLPCLDHAGLCARGMLGLGANLSFSFGLRAQAPNLESPNLLALLSELCTCIVITQESGPKGSILQPSFLCMDS